jgi:hypothetical protein
MAFRYNFLPRKFIYGSSLPTFLGLYDGHSGSPVSSPHVRMKLSGHGFLDLGLSESQTFLKSALFSLPVYCRLCEYCCSLGKAEVAEAQVITQPEVCYIGDQVKHYHKHF